MIADLVEQIIVAAVRRQQHEAGEETPPEIHPVLREYPGLWLLSAGCIARWRHERRFR